MTKTTVNISGQDLLETLVKHLDTLDACRTFISEFKHRQMIAPTRIKAEAVGNTWDVQDLETSLKCYESSLGAVATLVTPGQEVRRLLDGLEVLKHASNIVYCISNIWGRYDREFPEDLLAALNQLTDQLLNREHT